VPANKPVLVVKYVPPCAVFTTGNVLLPFKASNAEKAMSPVPDEALLIVKLHILVAELADPLLTNVEYLVVAVVLIHISNTAELFDIPEVPLFEPTEILL
jgi:hypothetical protein